jgi:uncharacterized protein (TIGR03000 family)
VGGYQSLYPAASPLGSPNVPRNVAVIEVRVPENAELWIDDVRVAQTGLIRQLISPQLEPGEEYIYEVRARWLENGRSVTRSRKIVVQAGSNVRVDFVVPAGTSPEGRP